MRILTKYKFMNEYFMHVIEGYVYILILINNNLCAEFYENFKFSIM